MGSIEFLIDKELLHIEHDVPHFIIVPDIEGGKYVHTLDVLAEGSGVVGMRHVLLLITQ